MTNPISHKQWLGDDGFHEIINGVHYVDGVVLAKRVGRRVDWTL